MEWLRRLDEDGAGPPSRWTSRDERRCRKEECITKIDSLKSRVKELEGELRPLKRMFKTEVEGAR